MLSDGTLPSIPDPPGDGDGFFPFLSSYKIFMAL
jgi:hypothetical protein